MNTAPIGIYPTPTLPNGNSGIVPPWLGSPVPPTRKWESEMAEPVPVYTYGEQDTVGYMNRNLLRRQIRDHKHHLPAREAFFKRHLGKPVFDQASYMPALSGHATAKPKTVTYG